MAVTLSDGDLHRILGLLYVAGEVDGPDAMTPPVVEALCQLVPTDGGASCNVFSGLEPTSQPQRRTVLDFADWGSDWCTDGDTPQWTDEFEEACRTYVRTDEAIPPQPRFMLRPLRISDVLSWREQRARGLWWHIERHVGNDSLWVWLPSEDEGVLRRLSFGSERRGGVRDRDVRVLEILTPHLVQLYRRAAARRGTQMSASALTPREYEIVSLVGSGMTNREIAQMLWLSPNTVRKHLENVFEKLEVNNRTAAAARVFGAPRVQSARTASPLN